MIRNERQLKISKQKLRALREALDEDEAKFASMDPERARLLRAGSERMIAQLVSEIADYQHLRDAGPDETSPTGIGDTASHLIRRRIALGLSQAQLADAVGIHENQIQQYESTDYAKASLRRLVEIEAALAATVPEVEKRRCITRPAIDVALVGQLPCRIARRVAPSAELAWEPFDVRSRS